MIYLLIPIIERVNAVTGLVLNSILLFAIFKFSGTPLGTYKHLLTIFTLTDLFLIVLYRLTEPRLVAVGYTYGIVTDTPLDDRRLTAFVTAFQGVPFSLLVIHFLYRYWSVCRPHLIGLFTNKGFVFLLISGNIAIVISWSEISIDYERKYGKRSDKACLLFEHWRGNKLNVTLSITTILENVIMTSSIILSSLFAILTFKYIKSMNKISRNLHELQKKLLIALCVQASVPAICVYIPYMAGINMPFFKLHVDLFQDLTVTMTTFFPVWDAVVVILLISDYRRGLMGMVRRDRVRSAHEMASRKNTVTPVIVLTEDRTVSPVSVMSAM